MKKLLCFLGLLSMFSASVFAAPVTCSVESNRYGYFVYKGGKAITGNLGRSARSEAIKVRDMLINNGLCLSETQAVTVNDSLPECKLIRESQYGQVFVSVDGDVIKNYSSVSSYNVIDKMTKAMKLINKLVQDGECSLPNL